MNFRKILALLMVAVMMFSLAACSSNNGSETTVAATTGTTVAENAEEAGPFAGKTLKFAGLESGYGNEGWIKVIAEFEKLTGAKVEYTFSKEISDELRPQIQAGNVPDLIYASFGVKGSLTETMVKENMLLDISDIQNRTVPGETLTVGEKVVKGFFDTTLTNPYADGKNYLAPLFYAPCGIFYAKDNFDGKYALPTTFDEFFALGAKAQGDGVALFTYPTTGYFDSFVPALINQVGGPELFNKLMNYDVEAWKSAEATKVLQTVADIAPYLHKDTVSNANSADGYKTNQQSVIDGQTLFITNGFWLPGEMKDTTPDNFKWGFMPLPASETGGDRYSYTYFEQIFIPSAAAEQELAKEFIAFLYSDFAVKTFIENGGAVQPVPGVEIYFSDDLSKEIYSIYSSGAKASMGGFVAAPAVEGVNLNDSLYKSIDSVMTGDKTVEQWQAEIVSAVEKIAAALNN